MDAVTELLSDRDASVRKAALEALSVLAGAGSVKLLAATLEDSNWSVRWAAVEALGNVTEASASPTGACPQAVPQTGEFVGASVPEGGYCMGTAAPPSLASAASAFDSFLQSITESAQSVAERLDHKDVGIRLVAAEALGRILEVGLRKAIAKLHVDRPVTPTSPARSLLCTTSNPLSPRSGTGDAPATLGNSIPRVPMVLQWGAALEDEAPLRQATLEALTALGRTSSVEAGKSSDSEGRPTTPDELLDKRTLQAVALRLEHGDLRVHQDAAKAVSSLSASEKASVAFAESLCNGVWGVRRAVCEVATRVVETRASYARQDHYTRQAACARNATEVVIRRLNAVTQISPDA